MAAVILTRRRLLRHPAFALVEAGRPRHDPGQETRVEAPAEKTGPDAAALLARLCDQVERLGKSSYRAAAQQESLARDLGEVLAHLRGAGAELPSSFVTEQFLPLVDSLHRFVEVLSHREQEGLAEGARLVAARGEACLAALGIEPIPALGERFDPRRHQAIEVRPAPPAMEGRIIEEVVRGYRRGDRVLRFAQVVVGKQEQKWTG